MFEGVISLIQSYGPNLAGWVLLFIFIAWISGKGGKLVVSNIKSLMEASEELRKKMRESLDDCELKLKLRDEQIRILNKDVDEAHMKMRSMIREMQAMETEIQFLTHELEQWKERYGRK